MYARFINEFYIILAPTEYWGKKNFNHDQKALAANGFLPVRQIPPEAHKRARYEQKNGEILVSFVEYTGDALANYRREQIDRLHAVFKAGEEKFLNNSDIVMASVLAAAGNPRGAAVTNWLTEFWKAYFAEKDKLEKAVCAADFATIDFDASKYAGPELTMRELSLEAADFYKEIAKQDH